MKEQKELDTIIESIIELLKNNKVNTVEEARYLLNETSNRIGFLATF